jgi:hypothetical protein
LPTPYLIRLPGDDLHIHITLQVGPDPVFQYLLVPRLLLRELLTKHLRECACIHINTLEVGQELGQRTKAMSRQIRDCEFYALEYTVGKAKFADGAALVRA